MGERIKTSVIIPAYNSEQYIGQSLNKLYQFLYYNKNEFEGFEIIVVDDGSRDKTASVVEQQNINNCRLIRHKVNKGKGAAVWTGMQSNDAEFKFFIDADLPYSLDALKKMLYYLELKEFDICIGDRLLIDSRIVSQIKQNVARKILSWIFREFIARPITGIRDTQCGIKGFRKTIADYLFKESKIDGFAFDVEILYLAVKNNRRIKKVPVQWFNNQKSSITLYAAIKMLLEVFQIPCRYYLGKYKLLP